MEKILQCFKEKNKSICSIFVIILGVFLISLIVYIAVVAHNKFKEGKQIGRWDITVTETGEVYAKPDLAIVDLSVVTEKPNVSDALEANAKYMNNAINLVKNQGVEDKDLKTTRFSISPRYEYYDDYWNIVNYNTGHRTLVGYEVTQTLQVKIRDMVEIGEILEGATAAGVNQIGDLYFTVDKQDELKKQAREDAINKAKDKAKEMAAQAGVKLSRIISISEYGYNPYPYSDYSAKEISGIGGGAPQIQTGENKVTVTVSITYEVK